MSDVRDRDWRALLERDLEDGWRAFLDQYTPTLLALIARSGVRDRDDVGDVYVRVCERLADNDCTRLRRYDAGAGALSAWLRVVVERTVVDWVRSRAGRRRVFRAIQRLPDVEQRVFELYYWDQRRPSEIVELLRSERLARATLEDVLSALHSVDDALSGRQRGELLTLLARAGRASSLDSDDVPPAKATAFDPERELRIQERDALLERALRSLPDEDAAIVRLRFLEGFSREQVRRALHLERLTPRRIRGILDRLKQWFAARRFDVEPVPPSGDAFEGGST